MKLSAFSLLRPLVVGFVWLALGLTSARAQTALPNAQVGVAYTFTVTTTPAAPSGTTYGATGLPLGLSINGSGVISGTPTTAGTASGSVSLTSNGATNSFTYTLVVSPAAGTPAITSATTLSATAGTAITAYTVTASNTPTSFNVGALPAGLSFTSPTISGTPTTPGTYTVALSGNNGTGTGATTNLTITVAPAGPVPAITSSTAVSAPLNAAFTYQITASPAAVSYSAAPLPLGLSLNSTTGVISGTPTVGGQTTVVLRATNNNGTGAATNLTLSLGALPLITSAAGSTATVGSPYSFTVTASNPPIGGFTITGVPPGLSASNSGSITGVPTTAGTFTLSASATNITGTGPASTLTLTVNAASGGGGGGGGGFPVGTAPIITNQPVGLSVPVSDSATFVVFAAGTGTLSYQWRKNGTAITGATNSAYTIVSVQGTDVASYDVVVTNSFGTVTSAATSLTVTGILTPPVITTQPASQTIATGAVATFSVAATGNPGPTYQWRKNGTAIAGATTATLTLASVAASDAATYTVVLTNSQGTVTSSGAVLTLSAASAPAISTQPVAQIGNIGGSVTFTAAATGSGPLTYQWKKNGVDIAGATAATLTLANIQGEDSGVYTVTVTNASGSVTSEAASLTVPSSRLANVSVRSGAGTGDQTLIVGLAVGGSGSKQILVRAIGPGLTQFGLPGALVDPQLRLFNAAGVQTNLNEDWGGGAALSSAFTAVGAFALPAASKDAALLVPLATGAYTAQVTAATGTGIALLEAYDSDAATSGARLVNISARTQVGTGDNILVIGFVVTGTGSKNVLIRAVGPGLAQFGVGGTLADPQLRLFNAAGVETHLNDDWAGAAALSTAFAQTGAFGLPAASKDAALLVSLQPGAYTAQVSGVSATTGVALVEVYEAP